MDPKPWPNNFSSGTLQISTESLLPNVPPTKCFVPFWTKSILPIFSYAYQTFPGVLLVHHTTDVLNEVAILDIGLQQCPCLIRHESREYHQSALPYCSSLRGPIRPWEFLREFRYGTSSIRSSVNAFKTVHSGCTKMMGRLRCRCRRCRCRFIYSASSSFKTGQSPYSNVCNARVNGDTHN